MKAIIAVNPYYDSAAVGYQCARFSEEFAARGVSVSVARQIKDNVMIKDGRVSCTLPDADFVVYLDKDKHLALMLEKAGYRLFNSAEAITLSDDKMLSYIKLAGNGIRMPDTVSAPLLYVDKSDGAFLAEVEDRLGLPVVVKENFGSIGKQVYLARSKEGLKRLYEELKHKPHLYQKFIEESCGRDVRVAVVGGKAVAAMERRSTDGDFRSNVGNGGTGVKINADAEVLKTAEKACKKLGLDFGGADILLSDDGPLLCEVNSNMFFERTEQVTGVNVAGLIAEYILSKTHNF